MLWGENQSNRARSERDTATGNLGPQFRDRIERAGGDRIDQQWPLGHAQHVAVSYPIAQNSHFRESRFHQPATGEARCLVIDWNLNVNVKAVALTHAGW